MKLQILKLVLLFLFISCGAENNDRLVLDKDVSIVSLNLVADYGGFKKGNKEFIEGSKEEFIKSVNLFRKKPNNTKLMAVGTITLKKKTGEEFYISLFVSDIEGTLKIGWEKSIFVGRLDLAKHFNEVGVPNGME